MSDCSPLLLPLLEHLQSIKSAIPRSVPFPHDYEHADFRALIKSYEQIIASTDAAIKLLVIAKAASGKEDVG